MALKLRNQWLSLSGVVALKFRTSGSERAGIISKDLFVSKGASKKIRKALPKGTDCRVIKGAGHCFPQAQTDLAVEYMLDFLK